MFRKVFFGIAGQILGVIVDIITLTIYFIGGVSFLIINVSEINKFPILIKLIFILILLVIIFGIYRFGKRVFEDSKYKLLLTYSDLVLKPKKARTLTKGYSKDYWKLIPKSSILKYINN